MDQLGDARLQRVAHAAVQRAHAELERRGLRDDVVGAAGIERADGDHRHVQRIDIAGDDALQPHHDRRARDDGVGGAVRHGAVSAHALQHDGDVVGRCHRGTVAQQQAALRMAGHVVHGEDGVAGVLREQPVFHHALGAAQPFFGGLEDQVERAVELAMPGQVVRRGQEHRRVAVVAAGMHDALVAAGVRQAGGLLDGQRVHVGPQSQALAAVAAAQLPYDAGAAQPALHVIAPLRQALRHQVAGAEFLEAEFGMAVDVPADRDELVCLGGHGLQDRMHVASFLG
ncbi:hypothetical protein D3C72_1527700 [compost metagenome]